MEEMRSQVSFELDTTMPGEHTIDFSGQNVIVHMLRLSNEEATTTIKAQNIRFREFPKIAGSLKIVATGVVFLPRKVVEENIKIDTTGGTTIWRKNCVEHNLHKLDQCRIPPRIEGENHSTAMVSIFTKRDYPIHLILPGCNVMVNENSANHKDASFTLKAQNIWVVGHQKMTGKTVFEASHSWTVGNHVELYGPRDWKAKKVQIIGGQPPDDVRPLFHLSNWKKR